jgi:hypothetical protein
MPIAQLERIAYAVTGFRLIGTQQNHRRRRYKSRKFSNGCKSLAAAPLIGQRLIGQRHVRGC